MTTEVLEQIKDKQFMKNKTFTTELHKLIKSFYEGFDLDKQDNKYREEYIRDFIAKNEAFFVNYVTNVYRPNLRTSDKTSEELTLNKFLDSLALYLTKDLKGEE